MKSKKKISAPAESRKGFNSFTETSIWALYPNTIKVLQEQRIVPKTGLDHRNAYNKNRGINATIILLAALTIEGFLADCLEAFTLGSKIYPDNNFQSRLDFEFNQRVATATFSDFPELFRLTLGKPLYELIDDKPMITGIQRLIDFRNGLAHSRNVVYLGADVDSVNFIGQPDGITTYEMDVQYKTVHDYLSDKGFVFEREDLFKNAIADHFVNMVKPFIDEVIKVLPPDRRSVQHLIKQAFKPIELITK